MSGDLWGRSRSATPPGGFYIFTIITDGAHQIITLRITPTTIPSERSLSFIFTIFADVARHASRTRWHPVSRLKCNVLPAPDLLLSPLSPTAGSRSSSHFHVGPARQLCPLPPAPKPLLCPPLALLRGVAATATRPRRLRHRERLCLAVGREGARAGRQHAGEGGRTAARRRGRGLPARREGPRPRPDGGARHGQNAMTNPAPSVRLRQWLWCWR